MKMKPIKAWMVTGLRGSMPHEDFHISKSYKAWETLRLKCAAVFASRTRAEIWRERWRNRDSMRIVPVEIRILPSKRKPKTQQK